MDLGFPAKGQWLRANGLSWAFWLVASSQELEASVVKEQSPRAHFNLGLNIIIYHLFALVSMKNGPDYLFFRPFPKNRKGYGPVLLCRLRKLPGRSQGGAAESH
jgi:hypothetical protein